MKLPFCLTKIYLFVKLCADLAPVILVSATKTHSEGGEYDGKR